MKVPFFQQQYRRFAKMGCLAAVLLFGLSAVSQAHAAAAMADQACDPQFMDAVEAKGWMDAQRQIAQNQNLIYKPDSVLEYTCFQQFAEVVAVDIARRFSESDIWRGRPAGFSSISTDVALQQTFGLTLIAYLQNNYPHTYRGGRVELSTATAPDRNVAQYLCQAMNYVWDKSRCSVFMEKSAFVTGSGTAGGGGGAAASDPPPDLDGFYEYTWYGQKDPRILPEQLGYCAAATTNFDLTQKSGYNRKQEMHVLEAENPNNTEPYKDDPLLTHLQFILPDENCGEGATPAGGPIPTGITVKRRDSIGEYIEHVCTNPGCAWNKTKCVMPTAP